MSANPCACCSTPTDGDPLPAWVSQVRLADILRIIAAWDALTQHTPAGWHDVDWLHHRTRIPRHHLHDLRRTRNHCAHPHLGPRSQADLDRALRAARQALHHLT